MLTMFGLTVAAAACGGGDSPSRTDVALTFSEWEIALDSGTVRAGDVTFEFANEGELAHNLVIVKSDLPPAELPLTDSAVDKSKLNVEGGAGPIAPGPPPTGAEGYTVALSAGKYVLFCDIVAAGESHYRNGMYVSLLVEP
jgi:plastocyanin